MEFKKLFKNFMNAIQSIKFSCLKFFHLAGRLDKKIDQIC